MTTITSLTVGYNEIDRMGIVHNSIYPIWFEAGRAKFLKKAGIPTSRINEHGLFLPLTAMVCDYKYPARFNEEISIETELIQMSCVKIKFGYRVLDKKSGRLLTTGTTTHAWTDRSIQPLNLEKTAPEIYRKIKEFAELNDSI